MKLSCFRLTEFDGAVHAQQDVVALDVSVDHLVRVEELQRLQTLETKRGQKEAVNTSYLPNCSQKVRIEGFQQNKSTFLVKSSCKDTHLPAHSCYLGLIHAGFRDDVRQRSSSQVLHHHPQLVAHQVAA